MQIPPTPKDLVRPIFQSPRGGAGRGLDRDVLAGLTLAAIAIPEQMATARLGGFAPQVGFFAFVAATLGFAVLGSNRRLSAGADSTITPIFAGSLATMAVVGSPQYAALAAALALMVGLFLVIAGLLKLGWIADLLSQPVTTGFLAGVSLHIVIAQAPSVLGLPEGSGSIYHRLAALWSERAAINLPSTTVGLGVLAVTWAAEAINPRIPGALIALLGAVAATAAFGLERHGVAVLGFVPGGLPHLRLTWLQFDDALPLVGLTLVIVLVVMVQTAATTRSFSGPDGDPDVDRDFVGMGVAGVLSGLFGAIPVNASPPRTAIVADSGGRSQFAGLTAALVVSLLVAFGTPLLAHIPAAALGGVLLFVAQRIFHVRSFAAILRRTKVEFALALLTTLLIVALPIQTGVAIGMFMSLVHGVYSITRTRPIPFERVSGTTVWWPASSARPGETEPGALVMGFQAPMSFLNAFLFRRGVLDAISSGQGALHLFVLEASSIVEIDFTASVILSEVIDRAHGAGLEFAIARLESVRAQADFERLGIIDKLGQDHVFHSVEEAIQALRRGR
jgi:sulfate permease, SulP family